MNRHEEFQRLYREGNLEAAKAIVDEDYRNAFTLSQEEKDVINYGLYGGKKEAFERASRILASRAQILATLWETSEALQQEILAKRNPAK